MREIVGAKIGNIIINKPQTIIDAISAKKLIEYLDRDCMRFMADLDLGKNWELMANGPTLFCLGDDGEPFRNINNEKTGVVRR